MNPFLVLLAWLVFVPGTVILAAALQKWMNR
jgi:hypothetical protein